VLWPELQVVGAAADGIEALRLLEQHRPDILFLDIQMPGASGREVARAAAGRCHIVFVTAFDQHAVEAFEQGAVDYVLKPVLPARLFSTVSRLRERIHTEPRAEAVEAVIGRLGGPSAGRPALRWINASVGPNLRVITVDEVLYFQADNKYTRVVTGQGEALIRKPLKELSTSWIRSSSGRSIARHWSRGGDRPHRPRHARPDAGSRQGAKRHAARVGQLRLFVPPDVRSGRNGFP